MSKSSNAAPVRDWLLKKYEGALKTIHAQTAELKDAQKTADELRNHIHIMQTQRDRFLRSENDEILQLKARIETLSVQGRVKVFVNNLIEGLRIECEVGCIASAYGQTQIDVQLPSQIEVPEEEGDERRTMLSAVTDALDSDDFKAYQNASAPEDSTFDACCKSDYPQGAISAAFHD